MLFHGIEAIVAAGITEAGVVVGATGEEIRAPRRSPLRRLVEDPRRTGYAPRRSFEDGRADTVDWYRHNRAWWEDSR